MKSHKWNMVIAIALGIILNIVFFGLVLESLNFTKIVSEYKLFIFWFIVIFLLTFTILEFIRFIRYGERHKRVILLLGVVATLLTSWLTFKRYIFDCILGNSTPSSCSYYWTFGWPFNIDFIALFSEPDDAIKLILNFIFWIFVFWLIWEIIKFKKAKI